MRVFSGFADLDRIDLTRPVRHNEQGFAYTRLTIFGGCLASNEVGVHFVQASGPVQPRRLG